MKKATKILAPAVITGMIFGATSFSASAATEIVEKGDTLWSIAQNHENVTVDELVEMNSDLDPTAIPVGTEIQISTTNNNEEHVTHTVQPGNTLYEIASVYEGVSLSDLYEYNEGIDPYQLAIGSEVVVVNHSGEGSAESDSIVYHTVQPGNTFYEIASVYDGVTVQNLMDANPNVNVFDLTIGSQIIIPVK
ncbi:LysM peptidoglycan-binding domain-containing protein [Litchfieldia salsa]|uniref:LysM domain-containing protein n=1 Tax=Litchfieldia salsa TaxID=930152 RepID=A0A1H0UR08_9BACI|nr:LysM domain-containing protein [Litchfieldia salsa]SDP68571.1 LysM domain-containing protein [Litchfieldia salsa]